MVAILNIISEFLQFVYIDSCLSVQNNISQINSIFHMSHVLHDTVHQRNIIFKNTIKHLEKLLCEILLVLTSI